MKSRSLLNLEMASNVHVILPLDGTLLSNVTQIFVNTSYLTCCMNAHECANKKYLLNKVKKLDTCDCISTTA